MQEKRDSKYNKRNKKRVKLKSDYPIKARASVPTQLAPIKNAKLLLEVYLQRINSIVQMIRQLNYNAAEVEQSPA